MLDSPIPRSSEVVNMAVECSCGWRFSFKPPGCSVGLMHSQILTPEPVTPVKPVAAAGVSCYQWPHLGGAQWSFQEWLNYVKLSWRQASQITASLPRGSSGRSRYSIPCILWYPMNPTPDVSGRGTMFRFHQAPRQGPSRGGESLHPSPATAHALCSTMDWANQGAGAQSGGDVATRVRYVLISKSTRI